MRRSLPVVISLAVLLLVGAAARIPAGILALGVVMGAIASLSALGLVLIYRTHRFVNLAHSSAGLAAGATAAQLVVSWRWNFWAAAVAGLLAGVLFGIISERILSRRLQAAPRLIVMTASLGLAQIFGGTRAAIVFGTGRLPFLRVPLSLSLDIFPVHLGPGHLLTVATVPVAFVLAAAFLRSTRIGLAARALGQNASRARALGLPVRLASLAVWVVAGALAAASGILAIPVFGPPLYTGIGMSALLLALAPAVLGRMRSLPLTLAWSPIIGIAYQEVLSITKQASLGELMLFVVIAAGIGLVPETRDREAEALETSTWPAFRSPRPLPARRRRDLWIALGRVLALLTVAGALVAFVLALSPSGALRAGTVGIFALAAVSLCVLAGLAGRLSLGHWALVGLGAATAWVTVEPFGAFGALLLATSAVALAAVTLGAATINRSSLAFAVTTLGLAVAFEGIWPLLAPARSLEPLQGLTIAGAFIGTRGISVAIVLVALGSAVGVGLFARTSAGRRLRATRDNQKAAESAGVSTATGRLIALAISGSIAGLAGYLYAFNQHLIHPSAFSADRSLLLLGMAAAGGLGSPMGALIGAVAIGIPAFFFSGPWQLLGSGAGLLAVVMLLPGGLAEPIRSLVSRLGGARPDRLPPLAARARIAIPPPDDEVLSVIGLEIAHGNRRVIEPADLQLRAGEMVSLTGPNGSGKTSLLLALCGEVEPLAGSVVLDGSEVGALPPEKRARLGMIYVDGTRPVFPELTVTENLRVAAYHTHRDARRFRAACEAAFEAIPALAGRGRELAGTLSGGEQRLLALAQTLFPVPKVLLVDEVTGGLASSSWTAATAGLEAIRNLGGALIVVEHGESTHGADRILHISDGRLEMTR